MGSMGVLYSVVLEVVPLFEVREVVVQKTWRALGFLGVKYQGLDLPTLLRTASTSQDVSSRLVKLLQNGDFSGTGIPQADAQGKPVNQYADLAINPNRRSDGDYDCWIGNRELAQEVPLDSQQPSSDLIKGLAKAFSSPELSKKLENIYGFGSPFDILGNLITSSGIASPGPSGTAAKLNRLMQATDLVDVALDTFLGPLSHHPDGPSIAQGLLTGILAGLLNTANCLSRSDLTGVSVGALGFPGSGVMGTAVEIALSPADAFGFIQTEILDKVNPEKPFLGSISMRLCSRTRTMMGMQQFGDLSNPCSVMIEVVGFGSDDSLNLLRELQTRTVDRIEQGLEAMLHWGLENDQSREHHLRGIKALQTQTQCGLSKLDTFVAVRTLLHSAATPVYRVFDNSFTERLGLSEQTPKEEDPYSFGTTALHERRVATLHFKNEGQKAMWMVDAAVNGNFRMAGSAPDASTQRVNLEVELVKKEAAPGDDIQLQVTFIGQEPGPHVGTLAILASAPDPPGGIRVIKVELRALVNVLSVVIVQPAPPPVLDFGAVGIGETKLVKLTLQNNGTLDAALVSYTFTDPAVAEQIGIETVGILNGQSRTYQATFAPSAVAVLSGEMTLRFTTGIAPSQQAFDVVVKIAGAGVGVQAELTPNILDFGTAIVGAESVPQTIFLRNVGQGALTVTGTTISPDFVLIGPRPSRVEAGHVEQLSVVFRPGHAGTLSTQFSVMSDSVQPPSPVLLHGVGVLQALLSASPSSLSF